MEHLLVNYSDGRQQPNDPTQIFQKLIVRSADGQPRKIGTGDEHIYHSPVASVQDVPHVAEKTCRR